MVWQDQMAVGAARPGSVKSGASDTTRGLTEPPLPGYRHDIQFVFDVNDAW
jgi:hypothetical protein